MSNMIVSENKIKSRHYNLIINGKVVEEYLSPRMKNILRDEYRAEGFAVDVVEIYSVTNGSEIVGENPVAIRPDPARREIGTPAATDNKIRRDRDIMAQRNAIALSRKNKARKPVVYAGDGRDRKSLLHADYLAAIHRHGFRVVNRNTNEVWIGLQKEISERIYNYINMGGRKADLDIKFIGKGK